MGGCQEGNGQRTPKERAEEGKKYIYKKNRATQIREERGRGEGSCEDSDPYTEVYSKRNVSNDGGKKNGSMT